MRFDAVVFDFDGTLVDSAAAKRNAFFTIFPADPAYAAVVEAVLDDDPDGSRYKVIPRMLAEMRARGLPVATDAASATARIAAYADAAVAAVEACPELPGAGATLQRLAPACRLYVASNTPHDDLLKLLDGRGWRRHLAAAFGYPHDKVETVAAILRETGLAATRLAVVGDGVSDRRAAEANGCTFFAIRAPGDLLRHTGNWEVASV